MWPQSLPWHYQVSLGIFSYEVGKVGQFPGVSHGGQSSPMEEQQNMSLVVIC